MSPTKGGAHEGELKIDRTRVSEELQGRKRKKIRCFWVSGVNLMGKLPSRWLAQTPMLQTDDKHPKGLFYSLLG
jgi:hypothetical protein